MNTGLPFPIVTGLTLDRASRTLRAVTYGRGAWDLALGGAPPGFSVGLAIGQSSAATVSAGQSASFNMLIGGNNGFSGSVTLSCSGAPANSSCSVPSAVGVSGSAPVPFGVALNTSTSSQNAMTGLTVTPTRTGPWGLMVLVATLLMAFLNARLRKHAVAGVICCGVILLISCGGSGTSGGGGGGGGGTPPGTYPITVTASSGSTSHTFTLSLTVQ